LDYSTGSTIAEEVDRRLDDLFGDSDESPDFEGYSDDFEDSPLKDLKPVVLSIDWEINDEIMTKFMAQVDSVKDTYKDDKILLMFLQLLGSAGKHIKAKKASSDPDVIRLLNSVYASLEKVILSQGMTEADKKKILLVQVNKFKKVREKIAKKTAMDKEKEAPAPYETKPVIEEQERDVVVQEQCPASASEVEEEAGPTYEEEPVIEEREKDVLVQEEGPASASEVEEEAGPTYEEEPVIEEREKDVLVQEEGPVSASEVEEEEIPDISSVPTAPLGKPRGLGLGKKISLFFLLPLIIVVAVSPLYIDQLAALLNIDQLAGLSFQIAEMLQTHARMSVEKARTIIFVILCGTIILICLIASLYGRRLSERIKYLTDVAERISNGELDATIEIRTRDEVGKLAEAIGRMQDSIRLSTER
jgi:HAMP domain-containing protein